MRVIEKKCYMFGDFGSFVSNGGLYYVGDGFGELEMLIMFEDGVGGMDFVL